MVFQLDRPLQDSFQLERKRFTVKEFHRMVETGILEEGSPYELLNGEIIHMATIGSKHAAKVNRISAHLNKILEQVHIVAVQNPIELGAFSQPEPDIAILRWQDDFYESGHPTAQDIYLLIEVSDTTLDYDRTTKLPIYAEAGIAEYWIVNLPDNQIEVYRNPSGNAYQSIQTFTKDQNLTIELLPEITIAVNDILG
jgi:Uma2 family endonuclease